MVLIDGRSGSGKTVLADQLATVLRAAGRAGPGASWRGAQVAHLDDWYPGWSGLEAATCLTEDLLTRAPTFPEWDWGVDRVRRWVTLDPRRPLIVEGAGALTVRTRSATDLRVWVGVSRDEDDPADRDLSGFGTPGAADERRRRARDRDGDDAWWDMWADQEATHIRRHRPRALADVEVLV